MTRTPDTQVGAASVCGYWNRTWATGARAPANTNLSIAFSGVLDPATAVQKSAQVRERLHSPVYLCIGGGASAWSGDAVKAVTSAIADASFKGYQGIAYDIEEGAEGLSAPFLASFKAARDAGLTVLVTISHSAPYGIPDAAALMQALFASPDIDFLSPQLYTTGKESANQYTTSGGVAWRDYGTAAAAIVPSIVDASLYADAQLHFKKSGVKLDGFIQWREV